MPGFLFDLDGVFYEGEKAVDGGVDTLNWCAQNHHPYLFVTNTTSRPRKQIAEKLTGFGIHADVDQILSPPVVANRWLKQQGVQKVALFVTANTREEFHAFHVLDETALAGAEAVIVGDLGRGWNFDVLNRAFRLLMADKNCKLIALGMTRYWRAPEGLRLDTAPFVAALQTATGREPVVCDKPALPFFRAAQNILGMSAEDLYMVGDDIRGDIEGAQKAGLKAVLVRTGKFQQSDLHLGVTPNKIIESIAQLPTAI